MTIKRCKIFIKVCVCVFLPRTCLPWFELSIDRLTEWKITFDTFTHCGLNFHRFTHWLTLKMLMLRHLFRFIRGKVRSSNPQRLFYSLKIRLNDYSDCIISTPSYLWVRLLINQESKKRSRLFSTIYGCLPHKCHWHFVFIRSISS